MLLDGMHLPLTTPFQHDGRVNLRKLEDNVRRYSKTPAAGLTALGRSGQPTLLSDVETLDVLRSVAATATAEKVLTAGVRRDSVNGALELISCAAEFGFDVALVPVPSLLFPFATLKEILSYFVAVADAAQLPVLLDSGPARYGEIPVEAVSELARHPNVIGLMDASGDAPRVSAVVDKTTSVQREFTVTTVFAPVTRRMRAGNEPIGMGLMSADLLAEGRIALTLAPVVTKFILKTRTKIGGFQILCGRTAAMLDALIAGAAGAMPPLAAAAPQACYEVMAAWKDGDPPLAAEKQDRLRVLAARVEDQFGVAGIKYGCDLNGYFGGRPRLPTLPLSGKEREEIDHLMAGIRN